MTKCNSYLNYVVGYFYKFLPLFIITFVWMIYTNNLNSVIDIILADESDYLGGGISIPYNGLGDPSWSPFYKLWYFCLSFVEKDPISLYFLNYKLSMLLPSVLFYVLLRVYKVHTVVSILVSIIFLFSWHLYWTWPRVTHFAIFLILLGLIWLKVINNRAIKFSGLMLFFLITSYIRPEYFLSMILILPLTIYFICKNYNSGFILRTLLALILIHSIILAMLISVGNPFSNDKRKMTAFSQHYSWNTVNFKDEKRNPWTNSNEIVTENFGEVKTPLDALYSNPTEFVWHVKTNIIEFSKLIFKSLFRLKTLESRSFIELFLILLILIIIFKQHLFKSLNIYQLHGKIRDNIFLYTVLAIIAIPNIISIVLIFPRDHYVLPIITLVYIMFSILLFQQRENDVELNSCKKLAVMLCIVALVFTNPMNKNSVNQKTVNYLKSLQGLKITNEVNILQSNGSIQMYLPNYKSRWYHEKNSNFNAFLKKKNFNMIILDEQLLKHPKYNKDPEWKHFIANYKDFGFKKVTLKDVGIVLLKSDLNYQEPIK